MVGSVLLLLLCSLLTDGRKSTYNEIHLEHKLEASAQIHWQHCNGKFNCLIPSKYFNRVEEKSLYVTTDTDKPFLDGVEIYAVSNTTWHLTLMANNSDSAVEFTWANQSFLKCDNETKAGDEIHKTHDSTVTALSDRFLTFNDPRIEGNKTNAMICKFKLEKNPDPKDDRTITVIFAALVRKTENMQMCLKITGAVNETFCNFIKDLGPHLRLSFNPPMCKGCAFDRSICEGNITACGKEIPSRYEQGDVSLSTRDHSGCEFFFAVNQLRVNDQFYVKKGSEIICHQDRWFMLRYYPITTTSINFEEYYIDKITSLMDDQDFLCNYSSPLKSMCKQGTDCIKITNWEPPLTCTEPYDLYYYARNRDKPLVLNDVRCNDKTGIWYAHPLEGDKNPNITYALRAEDNLVCQNPNQLELEEDDFDLDAEEQRGGQRELLRRDDAEDYTTAIVLGTVVGVLSIILAILICVMCASCIGPWTRMPVGLPKSEKSQRPLRAAGEQEMSFSDRVSLVFTQEIHRRRSTLHLTTTVSDFINNTL